MPGFDIGNSPYQVSSKDLRDKTLVQITSAPSEFTLLPWRKKIETPLGYKQIQTPVGVGYRMLKICSDKKIDEFFEEEFYNAE